MIDKRIIKLRKKLDELDIEHFDYDKGGRTQTMWESPDGMRYFAYETAANPAKTAKLTISWFPTPEQAIAATLGWIDEPDTIRNELADGGLIADALAPVCVDEDERRAFERGRVHERFAQQIFKEATS